MKTLLITALALASLSSFAGHKGPKEMKKMMDSMSFEDAKKMKMEWLDKKSEMVATAKTCVDTAKTKDDLMKCHHQMHESEKAMMENMHEKMTK